MPFLLKADSNPHLYFDYSFLSDAWKAIVEFVGIKEIIFDRFSFIEYLQRSLKSKNIGNTITKLALAAAVYQNGRMEWWMENELKILDLGNVVLE